MRNSSLRVAAAAVLVLPVCFSVKPLQAQETLQLEEVLVTAQKRSQSAQDVPISLSVVDETDLIENNIFTFADALKLTPGIGGDSSSASSASITTCGIDRQDCHTRA
jgi:iron complex outermembrane recepter protein